MFFAEIALESILLVLGIIALLLVIIYLLRRA
jgi:hypothetical protein